MRVAFIGLGEVGSRYSSGLAENGIRVKGYDLKFQGPEGKERFSMCSDAGVELVDGPEPLIAGSDIVVAVTSCHQAIETAEMYRPFLKADQKYLELNSAIPSVKKRVEDLLSGRCVFLEGATMNSPTQLGVATPVAISGPCAVEVARVLNGGGMNITVLGDRNGQASAYKVIRSIFTKSVEAALVESMCAARRFGIAQEVFDSITQLFTDSPIDEFLAMMIRTNMIHAKRRAEEVLDVSEMEKQEGMNNIMAKAAAEKLFWLDSLGMKEKFDGRVAGDMMEALDALLERS